MSSLCSGTALKLETSTDLVPAGIWEYQKVWSRESCNFRTRAERFSLIGRDDIWGLDCTSWLLIYVSSQGLGSDHELLERAAKIWHDSEGHFHTPQGFSGAGPKMEKDYI